MFDTLPPGDVVYFGGVVLVTALVLGRLYVGEHYFNDRTRFWNPLRRAVIPLLHRLVQRHDEDLYAETRVGRDELVDTLPLTPRNVTSLLADRGYEPQPLASLARDWEGRAEVASWARYRGPKPFPGAPDFLRPRQVHVRLFADAHNSVPTVVTAHEEATAWRPDQWRDHYGAETLDVGLGVAIVTEDLNLEDRDAASRGDASARAA